MAGAYLQDFCVSSHGGVLAAHDVIVGLVELPEAPLVGLGLVPAVGAPDGVALGGRHVVQRHVARQRHRVVVAQRKDLPACKHSLHHQPVIPAVGVPDDLALGVAATLLGAT